MVLVSISAHLNSILAYTYSAKIWNLAGGSFTLAISRQSGDYIPNIDLTPLDIVYNKSHLSILIHVKDGTKRKVLILFLFLQEVRWGHCLLARSAYYA
jgi:hypothetical protein